MKWLCPCRRATKRTLLVLLLFIVGGAIVNVAVAWGIDLWHPLKEHGLGEISSADSTRIWKRFGGPSEGTGDKRPSGRTIQLDGTEFGNATFRLITVRDDVDGTDATSFQEIWEDQVGWPARSMCSQTWTDDWSNHAALNLPQLKFARTFDERSDSWVSCHPLWPGFAINTIFYAAILRLLFAAPGIPGKLRQRRRIKRGLCPTCAYPVGSSDVCTECGKSVNPVTGIAGRTKHD